MVFNSIVTWPKCGKNVQSPTTFSKLSSFLPRLQRKRSIVLVLRIAILSWYLFRGGYGSFFINTSDFQLNMVVLNSSPKFGLKYTLHHCPGTARQTSVVTPRLVKKLFKPRHPSSLCGFHPIQLSAFTNTPNWTPINQHHPEGIPIPYR